MKMFLSAACILLVLVFLSFSEVIAQMAGSSDKGDGKIVVSPEKSLPVVVPKFETPPMIDGMLDEKVWKTAARFADFIQTEPGDQIPPSKETIAYMGYDEKNLYIAFFCFDDPKKIRATVARRDRVGQEDYVGVFLDTFNDKRKAYILQFNPLGIQGDGIRSVGDRRSDFSVDIVMKSKGVIHSNGWSVEVEIPFKSLRFEAGKGKFWGVNFWRRIDRLNREIDGWMPIVRGVPELQQLGRITGLNDIKTERTLEIVPSLTFSETGERVKDGNASEGSRFINRSVKSDFGVSIKYQITPNVTLDSAINPDFAEVEADAPVIRANQRFPIFFPEKRPFFLEGIDIFRSRLRIVNTRNIANPDVALKLTGKIGRNTFGVLGAVDDFPKSDDFPDGIKAYVGVLRLKRDIGENSNIGLFATQYHRGSDRHNSLFGFDAKIQRDSRTVVDVEVVSTFSRRSFFNPDINEDEYRTGNGIAYRVRYDYTGRNRGWSLEANGRSRDYRADVGFTRRTNTHGANYRFRLGTEPKPKNNLISIVTRGFAGGNFDESGRLQNGRFSYRVNFSFQKQLQIDFSGGTSVEKIYEDEFGARRNQNQLGEFFGESQRSAAQYFGETGVEKTFNKRISVDAEAGFYEKCVRFGLWSE